jgi:hypothetical protein
MLLEFGKTFRIIFVLSRMFVTSFKISRYFSGGSVKSLPFGPSQPIRLGPLFSTLTQTSVGSCHRKYPATKKGIRGTLHEFVKDALISSFGPDVFDSDDWLVVPTQPIYGDYQSNIALSLTKKLGMKPRDIAQKIVSALKVDDMVSSINITGPGFITLKLSNSYIQEVLLQKLNDTTHRLGIQAASPAQRIVVDFSSPNIAKEMHVVSNLSQIRRSIIMINLHSFQYTHL